MNTEELREKLERKPGSHKGENGKLLVIGGSREYTGAPALTAKAAYRSGCDLVTIATSSQILDVVAGFSENFIVRSYGEEFRGGAVDKIKHLIDWCDAAVIGPGIGEKDPKAITEFAENFGKPLLADADAIKPVASSGNSDVVFTPHSGELEHLEKFSDIGEVVDRGNVIIEKGKGDKIHSGQGVEKVKGGRPGMTVGGTGDVLAGITGSLLAQGLSNYDAAKLASWTSKKAGEKADEKYGDGLVATDVIQEIPEVLFKD